ncbi:MAG: cytochrome c-type biogenesis protein CcmH [Gammaproteobacteria bacterium]|jgi:cytochrome c-type biogenesis protein CcmH|nr:cytochrome c-type biogenesis protein [Gammaproteobacteria bacterium]
MMKAFLPLLAALLLFSQAASAIDSEPPFADPVLQARYQQLIHGFRCLVCQDETVADSDADLAADFRRQIHAMVAAGKDDDEIRSYMVERYGNYVLYKPPVQQSTWLLWAGPFILLCIAFLTVFLVVRRRAGLDDSATDARP